MKTALAKTIVEPILTDGREIKGASMRARLRAATEDLIAERGMEGASTVEIAKRCGVSRGAMLHHYPTRDEIVIDTAKHIWQRAHDNVSRVADEISAGRADVRELVDHFYEVVFRERSLLTMLELMVAGRPDTPLGRTLSEISVDLFRAYEKLGERAFAKRGLDNQKVRTIVSLIVCSLRGLRMQHVLDRNDVVALSVKEALIATVEQIFESNTKVPRAPLSRKK